SDDNGRTVLSQAFYSWNDGFSAQQFVVGLRFCGGQAPALRGFSLLFMVNAYAGYPALQTFDLK
ncbi:MAG: hypothetical protein JXA30_04745, partial [Deltaproteobacteria bacterium]|nr:hypothetical protein [Deltaproteobacteria bacterium]